MTLKEKNWRDLPQAQRLGALSDPEVFEILFLSSAFMNILFEYANIINYIFQIVNAGAWAARQALKTPIATYIERIWSVDGCY